MRWRCGGGSRATLLGGCYLTPPSSWTSAAKRSADPGPITPGCRLADTRGYGLVPRQLPGVMGPGFRQDDTGNGAAASAISPTPTHRQYETLPPHHPA